ncbi:MAG: hypothetical protein RLZ10_933 [Bacteroidota bacterium]|jgi:nucleoside-diphosphate-sugar epimerase
MRVLVTGGSGFIGTNLVSLLVNNGIDVVNYDIKRPKVDSHMKFWVEVDICNKSYISILIKKDKPDYIVHLAARTDLNEQNSLDGYKVNIEGVRNIMDAAANCNSLKRILVASSMLVCQLGHVPTGFDDYAPNNLYGVSKVHTEKIVKEYHIDWVVVRPSSIWGPWFGEPYRNFFDLVVKGYYFNIPAKHASTKTYGYVGNTCMQILALLTAESSSVTHNYFYLGDLSPINITEWANKIRKLNNQSSLITLPIWVLKFLAIFGDMLKFKLGIDIFPMNSFRYSNMTNDNIISDVKRTIDQTHVGRDSNIDDQILQTLDWLNKCKK